jgi:hypothetical protein
MKSGMDVVKVIEQVRDQFPTGCPFGGFLLVSFTLRQPAWSVQGSADFPRG